MERNEQIQELIKLIAEVPLCPVKTQAECENANCGKHSEYGCRPVVQAEQIYNAGYRKAETYKKEVIKEFVEDVIQCGVYSIVLQGKSPEDIVDEMVGQFETFIQKFAVDEYGADLKIYANEEK